MPCPHLNPSACTCSPDAQDIDADYKEHVRGIRGALIDQLISLKYAATVPVPLEPYDNHTEIEFLTKLCTWVYEYAKVLDTVKKTNADMAEELYELREQRRGVRAFLGIDKLNQPE